MPTFEKVTSDANEMVFGTLLDGYRRLTIPLFQRSYRWGKNEFARFRDDLENVVGADAPTRFIGAVVAVERGYGPNLPTEYEVVDGQQRLFTIYILIASAAHVLAKHDKPNNAALLLRRFLFLPDFTGHSWNTKLSTALDDAEEFADFWYRVISVAPLKQALGSTVPRPPQATHTGKSSGRILSQFERMTRWLESVLKEKGVDGIDELVTAATGNLSFVWLSLQDPASAPRIFESLNNRGVKTTVGDLVRNEIFARLRDNPEEARALYDGPWKAFLKRLGDRYEDFFFPYGLIINRNAKKAELFSALRSAWNAKGEGGTADAGTIIERMEQYVPDFLAIANGVAPTEVGKDLAAIIRHFRTFRVPSVVYPFVMQLLHRTREGSVSEQACAEILEVLESFLVRRALSGYEPTGLHAVFKSLWNEIKDDVTPARVETEIRKKKTVQWPSSQEVIEKIAQRELYQSAIASYVILEYDRSLGGDVPSDTPEIEHILPQKLNKEWAQVFSVQEHENLRHTWANLVPLSAPMNKDVSQGVYGVKRDTFEMDSMYKTPRHLAKTYSDWTPAAIAARAAILGQFAVTRWKY